jgi:hypothetical protein
LQYSRIDRIVRILQYSVFHVRVRGIPYSGLFQGIDCRKFYGISEIVPELSNLHYSRDYSRDCSRDGIVKFCRIIPGIVRIVKVFQNCSVVRVQNYFRIVQGYSRIVKILFQNYSELSKFAFQRLFNYSELFQNCQFTVFKLFKRLSFAVFQELIELSNLQYSIIPGYFQDYSVISTVIELFKLFRDYQFYGIPELLGLSGTRY